MDQALPPHRHISSDVTQRSLQILQDVHEDDPIDIICIRAAKRRQKAERKALAASIEVLSQGAVQILLGPLYHPSIFAFHIELTTPHGYVWKGPPQCTYLRLLNWDPKRKLEKIMKPYLLDIKADLEKGVLRPMRLNDAAMLDAERDLREVRLDWEDIMMENAEEEEDEDDEDGENDETELFEEEESDNDREGKVEDEGMDMGTENHAEGDFDPISAPNVEMNMHVEE